MTEISEKQRELLEKIETGKCPPEEVLDRFYVFLNEKPTDELLSPRWVEIWEKYKPYAVEQISKMTEEAVKSIRMVEKEIWEIRIDIDTRVTFLLGAGASVPSGIPTVDKLLSELWKQAKRIGHEDLDRLSGWCEEQKITNIEDLLTAAYISDFAAKNRNIVALLGYFFFSGDQNPSVRISEIDVSSIGFLQDTLQTLFGLLTSTMISTGPNPTHKAIVDFIKDHKNTSIITTNYDGCMDEALLKAGIGLKDTIDSENEKNDIDVIKLTKMHGSINWAYCDSCQEVRQFDLLFLKEIYEKDMLSYPVMGICKNCGGLRRPLLVPPLSFKFLMFPHLIDIWNSARQSIEDADYLIIVGYSFSEADVYITKIISRSMAMNRNKKMIIIDTNPNLASYLRERFSAHIEEFDQKRILGAYESCEKILPEILSHMLAKSDTRKEKKI